MYKQLTSEQRYTIRVLLQKKKTLSFIAGIIGVSVSTVSREISRNSNGKGVYNEHAANLKAHHRKMKKPGNRSISHYVRSRVFFLIRTEQWSPEEVSGWLLREEGLKVSKSTIYNWIEARSPYFQDNIRRHLRHSGKRGKKNARKLNMPISNKVSIDERPSEADGQRIGDWEMDTIVGKDGKGAIVTLVERKSGYLLMEKLDTGKQAVPLAHAVVKLLKDSHIPVKTITTDNGTEFAAHEIIAKNLNTTVYFAHPYCSWEKGAIENMNGLIRQYIPKKTDFKGISKGWVEHVMRKLNNRPRKKNNFTKPVDMISTTYY